MKTPSKKPTPVGIEMVSERQRVGERTKERLRVEELKEIRSRDLEIWRQFEKKHLRSGPEERDRHALLEIIDVLVEEAAGIRVPMGWQINKDEMEILKALQQIDRFMKKIAEYRKGE